MIFTPMKSHTAFSNRYIQIGLLTLALFLTSTALCLANHVSVKGENVNVRTGPSKKKPVYMELAKGYPLVIVGRKGDWVKVRDYEGDNGWVHSSLVEKGKTLIVNAITKINMRAGPSTRNRIIAEVYRGVVLTKLGRKGRWIKVKHDEGMVGWIYKPLLWP